MKTSITQKELSCCLSELNEIIDKSFLENRGFFSEILKTTGLAFIINNKQIIIYDSNNSNILTLNGDITEQFTFFINNFTLKNKADYFTCHKLLIFLMNNNIKDGDLFKIFNLLSWPGSSKGKDYYETFFHFSDSLKNLLYEKKIGLNEAYFFHKSFKENYGKLLKKLTEKSTFSENTIKIRLSFETAALFDFNPEVLYEEISECKDSQDILKKLNNIKYHDLYSARKKIDNAIKDLNLPEYAKITVNENFEKSTHDFTVKFKNLDDLKIKLNSLGKNISYKDTDYFSLDNIFNDLKTDNEK